MKLYAVVAIDTDAPDKPELIAAHGRPAGSTTRPHRRAASTTS
ncbi:hypothetical protein [Amycolatopsis sp. lyj-23]